MDTSENSHRILVESPTEDSVNVTEKSTIIDVYSGDGKSYNYYNP